MDAVKKRRFFDLLVRNRASRKSRSAFPARARPSSISSPASCDRTRIPDDVIVQVLTQSREDLIRTSFDSLEGARAAIVHLYNAVCPAWRDIVFRMSKRRGESTSPSHGAKVMRDEAAQASRHRLAFPVFARKPSPPPNSISVDRGLRGGDGGARSPRRTTRSSSTCPPRSRRRRPISTPTRSNISAATCRTAKARSSACTPTTTAAPALRRPSWG